MKKKEIKNLSLTKKTISNLQAVHVTGGDKVTDTNDPTHNTELPGVCTCYEGCQVQANSEGTCGVILGLLTFKC